MRLAYDVASTPSVLERGPPRRQTRVSIGIGGLSDEPGGIMCWKCPEYIRVVAVITGRLSRWISQLLESTVEVRFHYAMGLPRSTETVTQVDAQRRPCDPSESPPTRLPNVNSS